MPRIFEDLRVVELTHGMAGAMAGMLFADNGAEVIRIERPGGDRLRASPGFPMWNRGKKSVEIDVANATGQQQAMDLALTADVVIESRSSGRAPGLDHAALAAMRPDLVTCRIGGFGLATHHEHLAHLPEIVAARTGRVNGNDLVSGALFSGQPLYITSPFASFGAAGLAVQGIVAALIARRRSGCGQRVETSLLDGLSATTMRLAYERQGDKVVPVRKGTVALIKRGIMLCFLTAECRDGRYIQMCARQDDHFRNWLGAMELAHVLEDPRFAKAPLGFGSEADILELEAMIVARMKTRTQAEWMSLFSTQWDVGADPFLSPREFLRHPQMVENARIVTLDDPVYGPVTQLGPLAIFSGTPSRIESGAPRPGEHQGQLGALLRRAPGVSKCQPTQASRPPLAGLTIIELANFLAAPVGATLLAELGARVIKIEPLSGDSYRRTGLEAAHILNGKESLPVDLKTPDGRDIFNRTVAMADALIHNFRPGVPERLGVDYDTVRRINQRLVYLYGASYGSHGPERHRPAFHSTPHALCGAGIVQGGRGNPPVDDSYPDPCAGIGVGVAMAMGLYARERLGFGQYVETTMLTSAGYVNSERLTLCTGAQALPELDSRQLGFSALDRLYRTRDGWLLLCARDPGDLERLCAALQRPQWNSSAATGDSGLTAAIARHFETCDSAVLERQLNDAGIAAAAVADSFQVYMVENGIVESDEHPMFGTYWRLKPRVRFSLSPNRRGKACALGEHAIDLLGELGYSKAAIADLMAKKIVHAAQPRGTSGEPR